MHTLAVLNKLNEPLKRIHEIGIVYACGSGGNKGIIEKNEMGARAKHYLFMHEMFKQ